MLRVSAGARLISGEPSHHGITESQRIARELADLETVFDKIALILANFPRLWAANPAPTYRLKESKEAVTFLKKSNQKTSINLGHGCFHQHGPV